MEPEPRPPATSKASLWPLLPAVLAALLLGAHFLRFGATGAVLVCVVAPASLLMLRRRWVPLVFAVLLAGGAGVWLHTASLLAQGYAIRGKDPTRMWLILSGVTAFTLLAAWLVRGRRVLARFDGAAATAIPSAAALLLTATLLGLVHTRAPLTMVMLERFAPGFGWVQIAVLAVYAAWILEKMHDRRHSALWRGRIWTLFTVVFFGQLGLGLLGFDRFLQTGELHLPIPAMVLAGPVFRGDRFFMLGLFATTLLLVGPAWCSHLCYIGAWDHNAAIARKRPAELPAWRGRARIVTLVLVVAVAAALRAAGVSGAVAALAGGAFGLGGVAVMLLWSRRTGAMTHCTAYCPLGLLAVVAGKLNPFRIRFLDACKDCGACALACRYDALDTARITERRVGGSCTLCGDCIGRCTTAQLEYTFLGLRGERARTLFLVLVISLHATFLGVAMI